MRKRYLIAAGVAAMPAAGGAIAVADSDAASPARDGQPANSVTLPTGDIASLTPDGSVVWHPAGCSGG
ncbi:MAG: hypothetical protein ACRD0P_21760 [Stackebrandtia sp.]